jgi:hypothetical protein
MLDRVAGILFGMFGGKVLLRPGAMKPRERPILVARVGLNRSLILEAGCFAAHHRGGVSVNDRRRRRLVW